MKTVRSMAFSCDWVRGSRSKQCAVWLQAATGSEEAAMKIVRRMVSSCDWVRGSRPENSAPYGF